jgi:hypothetical protein
MVSRAISPFAGLPVLLFLVLDRRRPLLSGRSSSKHSLGRRPWWSLKGLSVNRANERLHETSVDSKCCGLARNFLHGVEEVAGSNLVDPTRFKFNLDLYRSNAGSALFLLVPIEHLLVPTVAPIARFTRLEARHRRQRLLCPV